MILFPAIDILNGRAVRLLYGEKGRVTDYGDPLDRAKQWRDCGARYLHVVDLSGAFDGESRINAAIEQIAALGVPVQSGGGLRSYRDAQDRLNAGAARLVVGTLSYTDPDLFARLVQDFKGAIVAGIDAKDGFLAVRGWTQRCDVTAVEFGKRVKEIGVETCVFTDISRDGAMKGVALDKTLEMQQKTGLNVIASGGISSYDDLSALKEKGVYGAILGRSIYEGAIDLRKAVTEAE